MITDTDFQERMNCPASYGEKQQNKHGAPGCFKVPKSEVVFAGFNAKIPH
jgi:hypothetical protein